MEGRLREKLEGMRVGVKLGVKELWGREGVGVGGFPDPAASVIFDPMLRLFQGYHPLSSQCFDTDMLYLIFL